MKPKIPYSWLHEPASTCFARSWLREPASTCFTRTYNGEGSYYCPICDRNLGSVWYLSEWRPTKAQALASCDCTKTAAKLAKLAEELQGYAKLIGDVC